MYTYITIHNNILYACLRNPLYLKKNVKVIYIFKWFWCTLFSFSSDTTIIKYIYISMCACTAFKHNVNVGSISNPAGPVPVIIGSTRAVLYRRDRLACSARSCGTRQIYLRVQYTRYYTAIIYIIIIQSLTMTFTCPTLQDPFFKSLTHNN